MRLAIAAFTAALLAGGASAQNPGTAATKADPGAVTTARAPGQGSMGITISPKVRRKLLQGLLNAVAPPRPAAAPAVPTAQPAAITQTAATPAVGMAIATPPSPPRPA